MNLAIDTGIIQQFFALPFDQQLQALLINVGWIPVAITILWGAAVVWLFWRQTLYDTTLGYVLLAIDIPRGNEQSPRAVENLFTYFGGAHGTYSFFDKWWKGIFQQSFSLEIVCINGYTQFLIHTPTQFRNLVESAVYSQYPDAEITEVNDYSENVPTLYPDEEYDVWGAEFIPVRHPAYPIKMWSDFISEMPGRPEGQFKDPMATLMDLCSSLKKGEQLWYQITVTPTDFEWAVEHQKEVGKILGESTGKNDIFGKIGDSLSGWLGYFSAAIFGGEPPSEVGNSEIDQFRIFNLKPQQRKQLEAIQHKASKQGFLVKNRFIYVAKKEVFNKPKVVSGFVGYIKQFMDLDLNSLKPDFDHTATATEYFFATYRLHQKQRKIVGAYKNRSATRGRAVKLFNIEELATLWHFPIEATVRAPLIQKAPGRKAEPPMSLPFSEEVVNERLFEPSGTGSEDIFIKPAEPAPAKAPSRNIPVRPTDETIVPDDSGEDIFTGIKEDTKPAKASSPEVKKNSSPPSNLPIG